MKRLEKEDERLLSQSGKFTGVENYRILEAMKEGFQFSRGG